MLLPAGASATTCGDDGTTKLFDSGGYFFDFNQAPTSGPLPRDPFGAFYDAGSNGPLGTPPGPVVNDDTYDEFPALFVGGTTLANLYHSNDNDSCSNEEGGQEHVFPVVTIGGLEVQRKIYVSPTGMPGARILNLITNPGDMPVNTTVQVGDVNDTNSGGDLGSDDTTAVRASSSGDTTATAADFWAVTNDDPTATDDPTIAHIVDGVGGALKADLFQVGGVTEDNVGWRWTLSVPAGGTVALVSYEVQQVVDGANNAAAEVSNAVTVANAYESASPATLCAGMSQAEIAAVVNWPIAPPGSCTPPTPSPTPPQSLIPSTVPLTPHLAKKKRCRRARKPAAAARRCKKKKKK